MWTRLKIPSDFLSAQLHWTGDFNQKAYHFSLVWAELCKTMRSCTFLWFEVRLCKFFFFFCDFIAVFCTQTTTSMVKADWFYSLLVSPFRVETPLRNFCFPQWSPFVGFFCFVVLPFASLHSAGAILWFALWTRFLTWSSFKKNLFLFLPQSFHWSGFHQHRWQGGEMQVSMWVMGKREGENEHLWAEFACGSQPVVQPSEVSYLGRRGRKMPLKASRGRSCPPPLRCLNFKGDSE